MTLGKEARAMALRFAALSISHWRAAQGLPRSRAASRAEALWWLRIYRTGILETGQ